METSLFNEAQRRALLRALIRVISSEDLDKLNQRYPKWKDVSSDPKWEDANAHYRYEINDRIMELLDVVAGVPVGMGHGCDELNKQDLTEIADIFNIETPSEISAPVMARLIIDKIGQN